MKKLNSTLIIAGIIFFAIILESYSNYNRGGDIPKILTKMQDRANKMTNKGALAVVGIAVAGADRIDIGQRKAIENGKQKMSEIKKQYVEASAHSFMEEIGVGKGSETNDVFRNTIESVTANILTGATAQEFHQYQTKENKKEGTSTYIVLYVITPETMFKSLENELKSKGSEQNLYQRYVDSEAKKKHDKKIEEYKKSFKVEE